jgi:hypothetical protein
MLGGQNFFYLSQKTTIKSNKSVSKDKKRKWL